MLALALAPACAESSVVFALTDPAALGHPGLLLIVEGPSAVLEARVLDPDEIPAFITLPDTASSARLIAFDTPTHELFEDEERLELAPEGEAVPAGVRELQVELDEAGDGLWREHPRSAVLEAFRVKLRLRCRVLVPQPPVPLGTTSRVVTIGRRPMSFGAPDITFYTEDGMRLAVRPDGTASPPEAIPRSPPSAGARLLWVESSGQRLHHFYDDGLIHVQTSTGTGGLRVPNRRIVAGDARLKVAGIEIGVLTAGEEFGFYLDRDASWTFVPAPGSFGTTGSALMHMSRSSGRVGLLSADGRVWSLVERDRPVVSAEALGSGAAVYFRELEPSYLFHHVTATGEVYRETPSSFELTLKLETDAPLVGAELGANFYAVSAAGTLYQVRANSRSCPNVSLGLVPDGGFEVSDGEIWVTGTDPGTNERVAQRTLILEP